MFTAVLPGLRHLRAPLAAGAVWLAVLWLLWGRHLPSEDEATGLLKDLYALSGYAGAATTVAALAFAAYLLGELWTAPRRAHLSPSGSNPVLDLLKIYRIDLWILGDFVRWRGNVTSPIISESGVFHDLFPRLGAKRPNLVDDVVPVHELISKLDQDLDRAASALPDSAPEFRAEYDQHIAEYAFRQDLATPLAFLTGGVTWNAPIQWTVSVPLIGNIPLFPVVCGLAVWTFMLASALHSRRHSQHVLLAAIYLGRVPAPALSDFGLAHFGPSPHTAMVSPIVLPEPRSTSTGTSPPQQGDSAGSQDQPPTSDTTMA